MATYSDLKDYIHFLAKKYDTNENEENKTTADSINLLIITLHMHLNPFFAES